MTEDASMSNFNIRHIGIFTAENTTLSVIGLGGIGSFTTLALAKMGCQIKEIWDPDQIEDVNIGTQMYYVNMMGGHKATALASQIYRYTGQFPSYIHDDAVDDFTNILPVDIIVSGLDSIAARKSVWKALQNSDWDHYLEGRMRAEEFWLHTVSKENTQWYDDLLRSQDDESIPDDPCTQQSTIYTGNFAAGHIALTVSKLIRGIEVPHVQYHNILEGVLLEA